MTRIDEYHPEDELYLIRLFLDDVKRQPPLVTRRQEIWLGAQINGVKTVSAWRRQFRQQHQREPLAQEIFSWVYGRLSELWNELEEWDAADIQLPGAERVIGEVLSARRNPFETPRSRVQRMINRIESVTAEDMVNTAYDLIESVSMLPTSALQYVLDVFSRHERLPLDGEFSDWMNTQDDLDDQLQVVLAQKAQAETALAVGYLRYPAKLARNYIGRGVEYLDLVQEGMLGAMRAVERFDYRQQDMFVYYISSWIWQGITRAIADQGRTIRIPVHFHEILDKVWEGYRCAMAEGSEIPTPREVALHTDFLDTAEIDEIRTTLEAGDELDEDLRKKWERAASKVYTGIRYLWPIHSIDDAVPEVIVQSIDTSQRIEESQVALRDLIPAPRETMVEAHIERTNLSESIEDALDWLPLDQRDRAIIELRFGLTDGSKLTLQEIGDKFELTRERVRQIEAKVVGRLQHWRVRQRLRSFYREPELTEPFVTLPPSSLIDYLRFEDHQYLSQDAPEEPDGRACTKALDQWLAELPGGRPSGHVSLDTRTDQLEQVLVRLKSPAHYTEITEELNEELVDSGLSPSYAYNILTRFDDIFLLLGQGVFSLVAWERARAQQEEAVVPYCPPAPNSADRETYNFFESVLIGSELLDGELSASDFLKRIMRRVGADTDLPSWLCQAYITAYYLVGAIPFVFYPDDRNQLLHCTLPEGNVQAVRQYCLETLNRRLEAMPAFWWLLRRHQPIRVTKLGRLLADVHPAGIDDASNRLTILVSLGAVIEQYGHYQLTPFGEELAEAWAKRPTVTAAHPTVSASDAEMSETLEFTASIVNSCGRAPGSVGLGDSISRNFSWNVNNS